MLHIDSHGDLLGDGRDVAAGPASVQAALQGLELVKATLAGPVTLVVATADLVLGHFADFDWVAYRENQAGLLTLVLMILNGTLYLFTLVVERQNFLNKVCLGIVGPVDQVSTPSGFPTGCIGCACNTASCGGRSIVCRHLNGGFTHEVGALLAEANRHGFLGGGSVWVCVFLDGDLLGLILLLIVVVEGALGGGSLLSVWVHLVRRGLFNGRFLGLVCQRAKVG